MTTNTIKFDGKTYLAPGAGIVQGHIDVSLDELKGPELVSLYNLVNMNLDVPGPRVNRFPVIDVARRRTWGILTEWASQPEEGAEPLKVVHDNASGKPDHFKVEGLTEAKAKLAAEDAQKPKASDVLIAAAAAARKAPDTTGRKNIWRRPKHENPSKVAYKPEEGTVQGEMYRLLTTEGGITMEDYCEAAKKIKTRDATLFTPPSVWGALRYLFVTNRGYGLDFDGERLKLLVPSDERSSPRKPKKEA